MKENYQWIYTKENLLYLNLQEMSPRVSTRVRSALSKDSVKIVPMKMQHVAEEAFGPWMLVGRQTRARSARRQTPVPTNTTSRIETQQHRSAKKEGIGSHFTALAQLDDEGLSKREERRRKTWVPIRVRSEDGELRTNYEDNQHCIVSTERRLGSTGFFKNTKKEGALTLGSRNLG